MVRLVGIFAVSLVVGGAFPSGALAALYNLRGSPIASFVWSPSAPRIGDPITLRSTSKPVGGAITRYAWDLSDNGTFGVFQEGGPIASVSFATPAPHVVRLRVRAADGLASGAAATITMTPPPESASVLNPFPVVSIRGADLPFRVRIRRLAVHAPAGVTIAVTCSHAHCPVRRARRVLRSNAPRATWVRFRAFERFFPAGAVLEVRVSKPGDVGAYTRFHVRARKLPTRRDSCLEPAGPKPIACPA